MYMTCSTLPLVNMVNNDNCCSLEDLKSFKGITVSHWNARSLFPKIDNIIVWLRISNIDCLVISESWLNVNIPDSYISIDGYNIFRWDRQLSTGKSRGGGLLCYGKEGLNITLLDQYNLSTPDIELMVLRVSLTNTRAWYVICIYRAPDGKIPVFLKALEDTIDGVRGTRPVEITVTGDINIDLNKIRDLNVRRYRELIKRQGLIIL